MNKQDKIKGLIERFKEMKTNPIEFVKKQTFKRSELNLDARVAKHWADKGLFTKEYDDGAWFIFDFVDAFWLKTIMKLREFNISLEVIKNIKDEFFSTPKSIMDEEIKPYLIQKIKESELFSQMNMQHRSDEEIWKSVFKTDITALEVMLNKILLDRSSYFLIIDQKGKSLLTEEIIDEKEVEKDLEFKLKFKEINSKSHLRISLMEILIDLVKTLGDETCISKIPILTYDEGEILKRAKNKNIKSIELEIERFSKAEIIKITKENTDYYLNQLNELIISRKYEYITIHTTDLEILSCSKPF